MALAEGLNPIGSLLPGDAFQCHVYLIEQGDQSVLIDPGSALTAGEVIRKVDSVVGMDHVRWLVCSHQDPDIIGALPALVEHGLHPDATIVTHWRDEALIVHSGTPLPFWRIEEHGWRLDLSDLDREAASELALHDPLTGLHNRLVLSDALPRLCAFVARADEALYRAKAGGRDRVKVAA